MTRLLLFALLLVACTPDQRHSAELACTRECFKEVAQGATSPQVINTLATICNNTCKAPPKEQSQLDALKAQNAELLKKLEALQPRAEPSVPSP